MTISLDTLRKYVGVGDLFIETGTHDGDAVAWALESGAAEVLSCEPDDVKYSESSARFLGDHRVMITKAESQDWLPIALSACQGRRPVFWLDAHGPASSPLLAELDAILKSGVQPKAVLVDDVRNLKLFGTTRLHVEGWLRTIGTCIISYIDGAPVAVGGAKMIGDICVGVYQ